MRWEDIGSFLCRGVNCLLPTGRRDRSQDPEWRLGEGGYCNSRKEQLGFGAGEGGEECTGSACISTLKRTDINGLDVECDRNWGIKCDFKIWSLNN